jgi:tyrosine aminotransferase
MYMMVGFDPEMYGDETSFTQRLITEESVYCLPGSAFSLNNWFRLVLTLPEEVTEEACTRIAEYCERHVKPLQQLAQREATKENQRHWSSFSEESMSNTESDES